MGNFCHLHGHSEYSALDGFSKIIEIPKRAKELNQNSIALTDHGSLSGIYKFYKACKEEKIKPILGIEGYLCDDVKKKGDIYHIVLLSKNEEGWRNILKLFRISHENIYYKPRIDFDILNKYKNGIICLSACLHGIIARPILKGNMELAIKNTGIMKSMFKDDFYIEIMDHGIEEQKYINANLREISNKYEIKRVATVDYHYVYKEDAPLQDILLCDQMKSTIDNPKRMRMKTEEFYIKHRDEIPAEKEELDNTLEVEEKCNTSIRKHNYLLLNIEDHNDMLMNEINNGLKERNLIENGEIIPIYKERLREEWKVIIESNLSTYLLTVSDYVRYAKNNNILVGPGRGSVGGCLIAYLLGIHDIDPIKHKLLFSRFYNPGRKSSLPDIDIDFPLNKIDQIIKYITDKYEYEKVSHIGTNTFLEMKGALKLICRCLGVGFDIANQYSKILDSPEETFIKEKEDSNFKSLYDKAKKFHKLAMYQSIHAAGIIISPINLEKLVPLRYNNDNSLVSCWDMKDIEDIGLIKYDILHLNTLDSIAETIEKIGIKIKDIPLDDPKTFQLINNTNNVGVFQLSSVGISKLANQLKVESIDDIAVVVALYRPGPLASNFHNMYIKRKFGEEPVTYIHEKLEPILKSTYGILIYQEQITAIGQHVAGFSETEADSLRKAVGKKIPELMKKQEKPFKEGCLNNGLDKKSVDTLWEQIKEFAEYSFNRSHSVAYAYITYYTAYLKAHYTINFMCSLLNNNFRKPDKLSIYLKECSKLDIQVVTPSVNGESDFSIKNNKIIFGLKGVKGLGDKTTNDIVEIKNSKKNKLFEDFDDFCFSCHPSSDILIDLTEAGAFDEFKYNRNEIISSIQIISEQLKKDNKKSSKTKSLFKVNKNINIQKLEELPEDILADKEYDRLGVYIKYNPLNKKDLENYTPEELTESISIGGYLREISNKYTKTNKLMGVGNLVTLYGEIEVLFFPSLYEKNKNIIRKGNYIVVEGQYDNKILARKVWSI